MPPNDSALFPLRFTGVHGAAGLDQQRDRFFEIPISPLAVTNQRQRQIAIDAKSVQVIQQVAQAAEIHDGTRITAVHDLR
jgi:hypothetical protein